MIWYTDLLKALNGRLKETYPAINRYGSSTTDGWAKPYFFTECVPGLLNYKTKNIVQRSCSLKITYFQEEPDELEQLEVAAGIRKMLGMKFYAAERRLEVKNYTHDFVGEYNNIMQITFDLEWFENVSGPSEEGLAEAVNITFRKGEE